MAALNFPGNPSNGDTYQNYVYDGTDEVWKRISPGGTLGNIDDVTINAPADGQALVYDSSSGDWINDTPTNTFSNLTDTSIATPQMGDSLVYDGTDWVNGPRSNNAIINGDFGIWQRGTSFTASEYTADRWELDLSGGTSTVSRESFTPADIEAIGYGDAEYFLRIDTATGNGALQIKQQIENVRTFAGQTVTLSFWAKGTNPGGGNFQSVIIQNFGSGGSTQVNVDFSAFTVTSSWVRYSVTVDFPSLSGKTIGTDNRVVIFLRQPGSDSSTDAWTLDVWGVQLEAGSVATPFRLAGGGSKAAELALCQRYYYAAANGSDNFFLTNAYALTSTAAEGVVRFPVTMRVAPSLITISGTDYYSFRRDNANDTFNVGVIGDPGQTSALFRAISGISSTAGQGGSFLVVNSAGFISFDAEL